MPEYRVYYDFLGHQKNYIGLDEYGEQVFEEVELEATDFIHVIADSEHEARIATLDAVDEDDVTVWNVVDLDDLADIWEDD